jgi:hypothetical protein
MMPSISSLGREGSIGTRKERGRGRGGEEGVVRGSRLPRLFDWSVSTGSRVPAAVASGASDVKERERGEERRARLVLGSPRQLALLLAKITGSVKKLFTPTRKQLSQSPLSSTPLSPPLRSHQQRADSRVCRSEEQYKVREQPYRSSLYVVDPPPSFRRRSHRPSTPSLRSILLEFRLLLLAVLTPPSPYPSLPCSHNARPSSC